MPRLGPGARAEIGAAVLGAAETVETQLVEPRLAGFAATHRRYLAAQQVVAAAEAKHAAAAALVRRRDGEQDAAVDRLACALIVSERRSRHNPFRGFGVPSPSLLQRLPVGAEARAIQQLVAAVQRIEGCTRSTLRVAQAAVAAGCAVEEALLALQRLEAKLRTARLARDAIGKTWDRHLAGLKFSARAAAADGAPHLHAALFGAQRRPRRKKRSPRRRPR